MWIDSYRIASTNAANGLSYVRVYNLDGEMVAEVELCRRSPLKYLRSLTRGKHRASMLSQLQAHGVPDDTINKIMTPP